MVRRTKEDALTTRGELLDAAERLFSEKGVSSTSMNQVAEAAEVTRGAIYHHFQNKLDLIDALMERVRLPVDEMRDELAQTYQGDPISLLRARCLHIIGQVQDDPHTQALVNILLHKCEYVDDALPIHLRHLGGRNACITECILLADKAKTQGLVDEKYDSKAAVIGLFSLVDGLLYNWLLDQDYFDLSQTATQAIDTYLAGLKPRGA
ncbi:TetR family transcriptional regulator [Pseudidiomarina gelatinasegens]|uniref:TetR family transcriptional regulator n=1 Tax=Pseudidiomarina gelatinasegens TaxID=2487740 RepID=UPI0030EE7066